MFGDLSLVPESESELLLWNDVRAVTGHVFSNRLVQIAPRTLEPVGPVRTYWLGPAAAAAAARNSLWLAAEQGMFLRGEHDGD